MCRCVQCEIPIICDDDETHICVGCGGRNRRATTVEPMTINVIGTIAIIVLAVILGVMA